MPSNRQHDQDETSLDLGRAGLLQQPARNTLEVVVVVGVALLLSVAAASPARAQLDSGNVQQLERQLRQMDEQFRLAGRPGGPISERLLFDYGASIRFALVGVDDEDGSTRILRQTDGLLYMRADLEGAHRVFGRLRFRYNDFNTGDSFDDEGDELEQPIADRYWYQYDLRGAKLAQTGQRIDHNISLKLGRQWIDWGAGISLSNAMYAGLFEFEYKEFALEALVGLTTPSSTIDFDGSRPGFDTDTDRAHYGAKLEYRGFTNHRPYAYFLAQRDENDQNFSVVAIAPTNQANPVPVLVPTRFAYDSEYYAIGSQGVLGPQFLYHAEVVYETGNGLSNSYNFDTNDPQALPQTDESIEAWAGVLGLTFLPRDDNNIRTELEFIFGSGDSDRRDSGDTRGGNESGSKDRSFNSLGYVHTGLALAPDIANLLALRVGWSISPPITAVKNDWVRIGVDGFLFAKTNSDAAMNFRTTSDSFIGGEIDFAIDWRISSDLNASLRYGLFIPGDAMPDDSDDPRHFFYAGVTYAF